VLAEKRNQLDLQRIFASLLRTADDLRRSGMPELVLEMGLLKAASLESVMSSAEISARFGGGAGPATGSTAGGRTHGAATRPTSRASSAASSTSASATSTATARVTTTTRTTHSTRPTGSAGEARSAASVNGDAPSTATVRETVAGDEPAGRDETSAGSVDSAPGRPSASKTSQAATAPAAAHAETRANAAAQSDAPPPPGDDDAPGDVEAAPEEESAGSPAERARDPEADPGERWAAFLQILQAEGGLSLFMAASNCEMLRMDAERLELRPMNKGVRGQLEDPEMLRRLRTLVQSYLGEPMRVHVVDTNGSAATAAAPSSGAAAGGVSAHTIEADRLARMHERTMSDPIVQTVLEVFDGKVETISQADD